MNSIIEAMNDTHLKHSVAGIWADLRFGLIIRMSGVERLHATGGVTIMLYIRRQINSYQDMNLPP